MTSFITALCLDRGVALYLTCPSFRWVLRVACLGLRLLRPHTVALGSLQRPRFCGGAAAPGEGDRGCAGQRQPWPRRRILGRETSWGLGIPLWGSEWRCWCFTDGSTFWWILFSQFVGKSVKIFAPIFGVVVCKYNFVYCSYILGRSFAGYAVLQYPWRPNNPHWWRARWCQDSCWGGPKIPRTVKAKGSVEVFQS